MAPTISFGQCVFKLIYNFRFSIVWKFHIYFIQLLLIKSFKVKYFLVTLSWIKPGTIISPTLRQSSSNDWLLKEGLNIDIYSRIESRWGTESFSYFGFSSHIYSYHLFLPAFYTSDESATSSAWHVKKSSNTSTLLHLSARKLSVSWSLLFSQHSSSSACFSVWNSEIHIFYKKILMEYRDSKSPQNENLKLKM